MTSPPRPPDRSRHVEQILARIRAGHSYGQIARDLGLTKGTIAGVVHRARQRGSLIKSKNPPPQLSMRRCDDEKLLAMLARLRAGQLSPQARRSARRIYLADLAESGEPRSAIDPHYGVVARGKRTISMPRSSLSNSNN
jgi:transposase